MFDVVKKEFGFSLVEMLITVSVLSVISLITASFLTSMARNQKLLEAKQNVIALVDEVAQLSKDPLLCSDMVGKNNLFDMGKAQQQDIKDGLPVQLTLLSGVTLASNTEIKNYNIFANEVVVMRAVKSGDVYTANVEARFSPVAGAAAGMKPRKLATIKFKVVGGKIDSCTTDEVAQGPSSRDCVRDSTVIPMNTQNYEQLNSYWRETLGVPPSGKQVKMENGNMYFPEASRASYLTNEAESMPVAKFEICINGQWVATN